MKKFKAGYKEIDARTEKEKGFMAFHRMLLIIGLSLYKALRDESRNQEEVIERIHEISN